MEQPLASSDRSGVRLGRRLFLAVLGGGALVTVAHGPIGRVLSDLEQASPVDVGGFQIYTVTGQIPKIDPARYRLRIDGAVHRPTTLSLDELAALPQTTVVETFRCVTGWSVPHTRWRGPRLVEILEMVSPLPHAHALMFYSADGLYTDSLTLAQASKSNVLLATSLDERPLSPDHGAPLRLLVPGMYGYKSVKWVDRITLVAREELGYWEQRGYPVDAYIPS